MNIFDNSTLNNDFETLLVDLGQPILINGSESRAVINNVKPANSNYWLQDYWILTLNPIKRGDIISYNNNDYIIWSQITNKSYSNYYKAYMRKTNYNLNIGIVDDTIQTVNNYPSFINGKLFDTTNSTSQIVLSVDQKVIYLQKDNFNINLKKQDRIIFNGLAWEIIGINLQLDDMIMLLVQQDTISDNDCLPLEIADYWSYHTKYTEITINNSNPISIYEEKTIQIDADTTPTGGAILYSSSDDSIATVDNTGLTTGIKEGTCIITAENMVSQVSATIECNVLVKKVYSDVEITNAPSTMTKDDTLQLIYQTTPINGIVDWNSSDNSIATVNSNGLLTAVGAGEVTITATIQDTDISTNFTVTIQENTQPSLSLSKNVGHIDAIEGTGIITPTTYPVGEYVSYVFISNNTGCTLTRNSNNTCTVTSNYSSDIIIVRGTLIHYPTVTTDIQISVY